MCNLEDFKTFFEETPIALIRIDAKSGEVLMANRFASNLFAYTSVEELKEKCNVFNLYTPEAHRNMMAAISVKGLLENQEIEMNLPDKKIWVKACLRYCAQDHFIEGALIDITEIVKLRNAQLPALEEVSKKLDKRIAALAS